MVVSGVVEARSCERFERLITVLDEELRVLFELVAIRSASLRGLFGFCEKRDPQGFASRLKKVIECDEALITSKDQAFRFHSGIPA